MCPSTRPGFAVVSTGCQFQVPLRKPRSRKGLFACMASSLHEEATILSAFACGIPPWYKHASSELSNVDDDDG